MVARKLLVFVHSLLWFAIIFCCWTHWGAWALPVTALAATIVAALWIPVKDSAFPGYITPFLTRLSLPAVVRDCLARSAKKIGFPTHSNTAEHARFVEEKVLWWVLTVTGSLVFLGHGRLPRTSDAHCWLALLILPCFRVFNIVHSNFVRHILLGEKDVYRRGPPLSVSRNVVLGAVNYAELIACFAAIYMSLARANLGALCNASPSIRDALYFSGATQLTIGYGDIAPTEWARPFAIAQGSIGLGLVVFIFGRFLSLFQVPTTPSLREAWKVVSEAMASRPQGPEKDAFLAVGDSLVDKSTKPENVAGGASS